MRTLILAAVALITPGCALQGTSSFNYSPTKDYSTANEKVVARAQPVVWDELVRELSKSFYVINNIERESRIINVSFNTNAPTDYVDCGRTRRLFTQGEKVETFDYAVAAPATFKAAGTTQPHPAMHSYAIFTRTPTLEGRSNIYVAPDAGSAGSTIISVNTRYVVSVRVRGEAITQHFAGNIVSRSPLPEITNSMIFSTNKPSTTSSAGVDVVCAGNGKLESEILNMVR